MGQDSEIEWTRHTFNCWRGCTNVSPGCANCYAETLSKRNPSTLGTWGPNGVRVVAAESYWKQALKWNRDAEKAGERQRVFCASLADVFEDWRGPMVDSNETELCVCHACGKWIYYISHCECGRDERLPRKLTMDDVRARLLKWIHLTPHLDWLLLTKRPEFIREALHRVADYASNPSVSGDTKDGAELAEQWLLGAVMPNVWLGVSVEDQQRADERIPHLLKCPAAVRFLSVEPLLGPVDLTAIRRTQAEGYMRPLDGRFNTIGWVIVGGESGRDARSCEIQWIRSLRDQCMAAKVACFVKQLGTYPINENGHTLNARLGSLGLAEKDGDQLIHDPKGGNMAEWPADLRVRQFPEVRG